MPKHAKKKYDEVFDKIELMVEDCPWAYHRDKDSPCNHCSLSSVCRLLNLSE